MNKKFTKLLAALALLVFMMPSLVGWGQTKDPVMLFHETFGTGSSSARAWSDSYSVKTGVSAVYSSISYTMTNLKQSNNNAGSAGNNGGAGLIQTSSDSDAEFVSGPYNVSDYESLSVTYDWKAASIKATYYTKLYYKTSSIATTWIEVTGGTGNGATTYVQRSYSLPAACQVETLYLKVAFCTSNTQALIDEFEITGILASNEPSITIEDDITELAVPNYVVATPANYISYETFTVNGSNLEGDVNLVLNENSNFQMSTDLETWTNTISLTPTDGSVSETVVVRLKAGLSANEYSGQITLSSTNVDSKTIDLSGNVTYAHVSYDGNSDGVTNVPTDNTDYSYNQQVTVLGAGDMAREGYDFVWWDTKADGTGTSFDPDDNENNKFNIIANTTLYAQWDAKRYNITKAAMTNGDVTVKVGENVVTSATTGATVSLVVTPATDYVLSELTVAKTGDATTTVEVINNQFIMPPYAVTVTATFVEHVAVFTNGVYSEPLTSQESFDNMQVVSTEGDETWVFNSTYNSSFITSEYDEIDWLITPKMVVENGKLNVSFQVYHKNYDGQLSLKWSASNDVLNGEWHSLTFSEGSQNGWRDVNGIVIETEEPYVYVAFVYDNTADEYAGQYQIRNFVAKQYYNVTFNANIANASGSMSPLCCLTNTATPLTANVFTAQGKAFNGWNTQADGDGTNYNNGANITITQNTTLYAQWVDAYTVTFITNGHADGTRTVISGATIGTLPTPTADFIPAGYDFTGWYIGDLDGNGSSTAPVYITSDDEITADVTLKAVLAEVVTPAGPETWTKITDLSTVTAGVYAIITPDGYAFNGTMNNGHGQHTESAFTFDSESGVATVVPEDICELTLATSGDGYTMYNSTRGYLYASSAESKKLAWHATEDNYWYCGTFYTLEKDWGYSKEYTINNNKKKAVLRAYMDNNSNTFRTYGSNSGVLIQMAKKTPGTPAVYGDYYTFSGIITTISENTTRTEDIPMNEFVTVMNGATFTFSGSNLGTAENLIIEDGGQLDHSNTGVFATMQKGITAHGETVADGGFYFISAPMTSLTIDNTEHTNILSNSDLYIFDQTRELEWQNYKKNNTENHTTFTTLEEGKGYLYANDNTFTALFMGELAYSSDGVVPVSYSTANTDENMHGWNLIGNPFACNAYLTQSYYGIDPEGGRNVVARTGAIAPCEGVMVQAASNQTSVTFSKTAPQSGSGASLQMTIGQQVMNRDGVSSTDIDNAIVSFNEGSELPKFYFMEQNANLYIPQNDKEYAIVSAEAQGELPLNFRANADGQYTLTVNPEGVEMNYLHLVDNMTGNDIDLLQTPSYSFNAKTTDYESRFRLVFAANNESGVSAGSTTFAFYSNGNWMVNNEGEASLQVIDVMGRVLSNQTISGTAELSLNQQPGVYVLRLVNGNDVKTQKIVVR